MEDIPGNELHSSQPRFVHVDYTATYVYYYTYQIRSLIENEGILQEFGQNMQCE